MKIAFCSSEVFPYAKTGGLGDVSAALPEALAKAGVEVKVFMPLHKGIKPQEMHDGFGLTRGGSIETFFIKHDQYFLRDSIYVGEDGNDYSDSLERFSYCSKEVLRVLKKIFQKTGQICRFLQERLLLKKERRFGKLQNLFFLHPSVFQMI